MLAITARQSIFRFFCLNCSGRVRVQKNIREFSEEGVIFENGSKAKFDAVVLCTGYKMSLPFTQGQEAAGTVAALGAGVSGLAVGDRVELVPGYCPTTVNLHELYHVVEEGVVVDLWPILARAAGAA